MKKFDELLEQFNSSSTSTTTNTKRTRLNPSIPVIRETKVKETSSNLSILVVLCAGPTSCHDKWEFDENMYLCLMWYGKEEPDEKFIKFANKIIHKRGPKWVLVRTALNEAVPNWRDEYDFIWIPDDDLNICNGNIRDLANIMHSYDLHLCQPCLTDLNITVPTYRPILLRCSNEKAIFHRTNFVEIMCPMFSVQGLKNVFNETIDCDTCKSGWGLDSVWPNLIVGDKSVAVIDVVQVEHTRPPNAFLGTASSYNDIDPRLEEFNLLKRFQIRPFIKKVFEIVII